ncbi:MAG: hypothetical protein HYR96_06550 [Deltaproteobacteria bacterium]|nr:hypothetical protein [Deltaproteobacteria bacterium]MBI3295731.1 hypothetical protein [Deltaproteobacteria bacterium]
MKQWILPNLSLDLSHLWTHPGGPRLTGEEGALSQRVWKAFRHRSVTEEIGFFDLPETTPEAAPKEWAVTAHRLRSSFDGAIIVGIGGSYLGPQTLLESLRVATDQEDFPILWVTQPDPERIHILQRLALEKRYALVVISKSGNTTETLSAFFNLSQSVNAQGYLIITDPEKGALREMARREGWSTFSVPPDVGGRFSVLTSVGLFPAELAKISSQRILTGARRMREAILNSTPDECPAFWLALSHFRWDTEFRRNIHYLMPYRQTLKSLAEWHTQLFAESLGKIDRTGKAVGFTPVAALGPSDQHSILQMLRQGPRDKMVGFIDTPVKASTVVGMPSFSPGEAAYLTKTTFEQLNHLACRSTELSLQNGGMPTYRLALEGLSPEALGSAFFFFETVCALAGELYDVDAFGQPGVEEGKRLLKEALI